MKRIKVVLLAVLAWLFEPLLCAYERSFFVFGMQGYSTAPSRLLIQKAVKMLAHAEPIVVLGDFGDVAEMPQNQTDTLVYRRLNPFGMNANGTPNITVNQFAISEGVTPNANTIAFTDVSVTLQQFGILYQFSSKVASMYEDNIPEQMVVQTGETLGEVLELLKYGVVKGGTGVVFSNGAVRTGVNTPVNLNRLRQAARNVMSARGKKVTQKVAAGTAWGVRPVEPAFLVFHHTDVNADIRNLPGFTKVVEYGQSKPVHDNEIGAVDEFRFIASPLLVPFLAGGSATLNGCVSVGAANVDVYPLIITGKDAWGSVGLKGMNSISPTIIPANVKNHANPLGLFGFVGASTWSNTVRTNENWMTRLECGVTTL